MWLIQFVVRVHLLIGRYKHYLVHIKLRQCEMIRLKDKVIQVCCAVKVRILCKRVVVLLYPECSFNEFLELRQT